MGVLFAKLVKSFQCGVAFFATVAFGKNQQRRDVVAVGYVFNRDIIENLVFVVPPLPLNFDLQMKIRGIDFLETVEQLHAVKF